MIGANRLRAGGAPQSVVGGVVMATLLGGPCLAEMEPSAIASVSVAGEWNDNPRMLARNGESVTGLNASAGIDLQGQTDVLALSASGLLRSYRYDEDSTLDRDDYFISGVLRREFDRQSIDLGARLNRESTLTGELESTGRVNVNKRRNTGSISPAWEYEFSEDVSLRIGGRYSDVHYEDAAGTGLVDYSAGDASASGVWAMNEFTQTSLGIYVSEVRTPSRGQETDSYGWQGTLRRDLGEDSVATFKLGSRRTTQTYNIFSNLIELPDDGWLLGAEYAREWSYSRISGGVSRTADPSGGVLQQRDRIYGTLGFDLAPFSGIALSSDVSEFRDLTGTGSEQRRDYRRADVSYYWQFSPGWRFTGTYSYVWQRYEATGVEANQGIVRVGVDWRDEVWHP